MRREGRLSLQIGKGGDEGGWLEWLVHRLANGSDSSPGGGGKGGGGING